ncbi:preprotein translocase subunit SecA [Streptomonospora nanhaiensis]|uniref:Protein translocase subunit SecA n=1 Tax=Streptomonospora nanhaiensis TaxID=1323731 RepID=A0A853BKP3_9ACTN|nr:preprotein translocase subunit SecA [Streptomonospora nanhaiensis]MBV2362104.1 preprotein translocase subunit SecA [Streptomonospora nanhaiensis]MBV2364825.1 preprotein translocase subunit SecA [Streptomonospora nanhaiensis]MBX9388556.1 preprotein translocase subunit SecA [Streptomonospora nanhaiensis]NYI96068.1 preprotein translocase subunit SecA [Streptomonospora nanhaiensis]
MPGILDKVLRAGEGKILRKLRKLRDQINSIEDDFVDLSDTELRELTDEFRERHKDGESLDDLLPEAFATVREAAKRTLGQRHFDVQLMGGVALHLGNIAEMKTGEGKTLTSTLAVYLNALSGKGVHVVTVNDYLAKRDAENMGRIYQFLGMEVGVLSPDMRGPERRAAYAADITYGTNNEFGFDYLRDNMALSLEETVQRGHAFAIVDEVDSILIDEARTPLIISGPAEQNSKWYAEFAKIAPRLRRDVDYEVDEKHRTVGITESGVAKVEDYLGIDNLYESANTPLISFLNNAIKAKELYRRDKEYIVKDGEVLIVDEFTGRVLRGRRYNEGMHQAIEAKEKVRIKDENQTQAKITLQNYFRLYDKLAGMTGTAATEAAEFNQTYGIGVVPIPTNKPMVRTDERDVIYKGEEAKFEAVVDDIAERHEEGQPVLVGTTSVEKSELLSKMLKRRGIPHEVLNAKNHAREASIIARAGRLGAVTVATNMAGRGTDIMLGGNPEFMADEELQKRGLQPLETPEEYEKAWPEALEKAKKEVESEHEQVVEAGGLYVLGTERHESRRIDNQLRGRSGRQGDPGVSRFYLSLEDDLMRLFNSARVEMIYDRLNIPDDQPIESSVVTKAIQSAQAQVEQQNFEIRKNVLKYDEVLNRQRKVIYAERRKVLEGADLKEQALGMIDDVLDGYVRAATAEGDPGDWDFDKLWTAFKQIYPVSFTVDELIEENGGELANLTPDIIAERVIEDAHTAYEAREEALGADNMRVLERRVILIVMSRKWQEHLYEMDYLQQGIGLRAMAQRNPLIEYQREGFDMFQQMLEAIKEETASTLYRAEVRPARTAVTAATAAATAGARGAALATAPSGTATEETDEDTGSGDSASGAAADSAAAAPAEADSEEAAAEPVGSADDDLEVAGLSDLRPSRLQYSAPAEGGGVETRTETVEDAYAGTSRNAPCPCGSGKKYKRCHGDPRNR